ncbi:MAG: hypothetical protein Q9171_005287 [Xanthocarpia ochracea]
MATTIGICSLRGHACLTGLRHTRGYCWSKRHHWRYDTYPESLKAPDSHTRTSSASDTVRFCYRRTRNDLGSYNYNPTAPGGSRASSSWGPWTSNWDNSSHKSQTEINHNRDDTAAWSRTYVKLEKDTTELYELIKKRIDADPFDALFGRSLLYPNRARTTWWGVGRSDRGPKTEQQAPSTSCKPTKTAESEGINKQHPDQASKSPSSIQHTSASSGVNNFASSSFLAEEYDIDPIAMRKIPKRSTGKTLEKSTTSIASNRTFDIPIKRFEETIAQKSSRQLSENENSRESNPTASQLLKTGSNVPQDLSNVKWSSHEGFGSKRESAPVADSRVSETATKLSPTRIESTLERRMRTGSPIARANGARSSLTYDPKENRTDDVDLLRTSDIRAASGAAGRLREQTEKPKHQDRMKLEADFTALQKTEDVELEWKKELAIAKRHIQEADARKRGKTSNDHFEEKILPQRAAMEALEMRRDGDRMLGSHLTVAHGEGDMASNVHEFADRDRWYKTKAPHAATIEEQKPAKARSLVREIRGIYEGIYGAIDTKHRQPEKKASNIEEQNSITSPRGAEGSIAVAPEGVKNATQLSGPLSTQETIGTMLQQLLDDSRYLQKLLQTPELTPEIREELYHRNRSMQNASNAITEALSSTFSVLRQGPAEQTLIAGDRTATNEGQEGLQPVSFSTDVKKQSTVYSVLAYDPSIQQVTTAEMASSSESSSERRLSLSEALSSLTEPVKFLPQLTALQSQGFEIVSSDTNILVLKKSNKAAPPMADVQATADKKEHPRFINPIDGTTTQTEKDFTIHDSKERPPTIGGEEAEQTLSAYKVRRKEDVFSGSGGNRWDDHRGTSRKSRYRRTNRTRRTTKRMLWVGLWTAGCCYVVGAITELLRA